MSTAYAQSRRGGGHNAKLSLATAREMRQVRQRERLSYDDLGKRFGVSESLAILVCRGKAWADPGAPLPTVKSAIRNDAPPPPDAPPEVRLAWLLRPIRSLLGSGTRPAYVVNQGGCWLWQGALNKGYAVRSDINGLHVEVYRLTYGAVPTDRQLDHLCRNRACINPDHLEPVTQTENLRRGRLARGMPR